MEQGFFPLDRRLRLERGRWSETVVQEAARLGATQPSFEVAAETYVRLTGGCMSTSTLWRLTQEMGQSIQAVQEAEEEAAVRITAPLGAVPLHDPIDEHANVSLDGATVLTRESGYREVKAVAISCVGKDPQGERVRLDRHSYRARLCDKAEFERVQWAEACRRGVSAARQLSSVNDGAPWIWDIVLTCYPEAVEILDWPHATQHLWKAGWAAYGEGTDEAKEWVKAREDMLWEGDVAAVQQALERLFVQEEKQAEKVRQVQEYVTTHGRRMDYARFRAEGRPIGSGTIESGCKNVIGWRMKRGGARWSEEGVNRMLPLLGEIHSGRWSEAWRRAQCAT